MLAQDVKGKPNRTKQVTSTRSHPYGLTKKYESAVFPWMRVICHLVLDFNIRYLTYLLLRAFQVPGGIITRGSMFLVSHGYNQ